MTVALAMRLLLPPRTMAVNLTVGSLTREDEELFWLAQIAPLQTISSTVQAKSFARLIDHHLSQNR
jgi:hypothetical protein